MKLCCSGGNNSAGLAVGLRRACATCRCQCVKHRMSHRASRSPPTAALWSELVPHTAWACTGPLRVGGSARVWACVASCPHACTGLPQHSPCRQTQAHTRVLGAKRIRPLPYHICGHGAAAATTACTSACMPAPCMHAHARTRQCSSLSSIRDKNDTARHLCHAAAHAVQGTCTVDRCVARPRPSRTFQPGHIKSHCSDCSSASQRRGQRTARAAQPRQQTACRLT